MIYYQYFIIIIIFESKSSILWNPILIFNFCKYGSLRQNLRVNKNWRKASGGISKDINQARRSPLHD